MHKFGKSLDSVRASLKSAYGTDMRLELEAERAEARVAIRRMGEEAEALSALMGHSHAEPINNIHDAMEAIARDLN